MKTLPDVGIVLLDTFRGRAYLQGMLGAGLAPADVILLRKAKSPAAVPDSPAYASLFRPNESVEQTLRLQNVLFRSVEAAECNDPLVIAAVQASPVQYLVYSGGGILRREILRLGKRFIHVHPGIVPRYRGSTCFYYSILAERMCGATAFFMEEGIDTGNVIAQREYRPPEFSDLDNIFDPWMRADLLTRVLCGYAETGQFPELPQSHEGSETYYVIHPVLKHLAIEYCVHQGSPRS